MTRNHSNREGDDLRSLIPAYLSGTLERRPAARFQERLRADAELQRAVEMLARLWEELPDRASASVPFDLWPAVRSRLAAERSIPFPAYQPRWRVAVSFATGLLVGLTVWLLGTGGPSAGSAAENELLAQESVFESLDPIPPESVGDIYFTLLPLGEQPTGGGK